MPIDATYKLLLDEELVFKRNALAASTSASRLAILLSSGLYYGNRVDHTL